MSEPEKTREERNNQNERITAVDLAEAIIDCSSTLMGVVSELNIEPEVRKKMMEVLKAMQAKAIRYTIAAARRSQAQMRRSSWRGRRGRTWGAR